MEFLREGQAVLDSEMVLFDKAKSENTTEDDGRYTFMVISRVSISFESNSKLNSVMNI